MITTVNLVPVKFTFTKGCVHHKRKELHVFYIYMTMTPILCISVTESLKSLCSVSIFQVVYLVAAVIT